MATLFFFLAAIIGLLGIGFALAYFHRRASLTIHQYSSILAIGMFFTWLLSFFAPFMAPRSQIPNRIVTVFGLALAVGTGLLTYIIVYIFLKIKDRNK